MKIFGILNITPDSFSDGGQFNMVEQALRRAEQLMKEGAHAIDIGAESTRPGATSITSAQELERLLPVLSQMEVPLSIDTYHPETAKIVVRFDNVKYLNDVSGFTNPHMLNVARDSGVNIIVMHSLSVPSSPDIIINGPVIPTLQKWICEKFEMLTGAGILAEKIIFDPGIGFGKSHAQSQEIVDNAQVLAQNCHDLGARIYYGHSRKSFLGGSIMERDAETARISAELNNKGVDFIRVHDVKANLKALEGEFPLKSQNYAN